MPYKYIHPSTVVNYKFEVLELYSRVSIPEGNSVLFLNVYLLHLFTLGWLRFFIKKHMIHIYGMMLYYTINPPSSIK